jgi:predicted MFS family arabinose efflux permease
MTPSRFTAQAVLAGLNDRTIMALGLTQTIGYGSLFYAYGVLAPAIARDFGVGLDWFFGAFTIGLLLGGLIAPLVGRELDRRGARAVMRVGSLLAGLALLCCAIAPSLWVFATSIILAEAAACLVLYEAAFAALTQIHRHEARRGITLITLIAGFASTVFWPLTQFMLVTFDWRWTLAIFALAHLAICAPIHHALLRRAVPLADTPADPLADPLAPSVADPPVLTGAERQRALALFTVAISISGLVYSCFPVHMLRIIENEGFSPEAAALVAMVMGPAQVLARFVEITLGHRFDPLMTGRAALGTAVASIAVLLLVSGTLASAIIFATLYGASQGLITIARGTVPLQLFGPKGYGTLVGRITGLRFLVNAAGPFLFALAATHLSMDRALAISAVVALMAFLAFLFIRPPKPAG